MENAPSRGSRRDQLGRPIDATGPLHIELQSPRETVGLFGSRARGDSKIKTETVRPIEDEDDDEPKNDDSRRSSWLLDSGS